MSRRSQRLDILTAAGLAESERDREIREGQRDAATTGAWANAFSSLVPAGVSAASTIGDTLGEQAENEATTFAARNADVVDNEEARSLMDANPELSEKSGGILDNLMRPIRARGRAAASTALASSVKANTEKRTAATAAAEKAAAAKAAQGQDQRNAEAKMAASNTADVTALELKKQGATQNAADDAAKLQLGRDRLDFDKSKPRGPKPKTPEQEQADAERAELRRLQIKALGGKIDRADAAPDLTAPTPATVTSLQKTRTDRMSVRQSLARVRQLVGDPEVAAELGKASSISDAVRRLAGSSNEKFRRVATPLQQFTNAYKNQVTGAAASDKEMETSILPSVPTMEDAPADFFVKLEENERGLSSLIKGIDAILKRNDVTAGDDVSGSDLPSADEILGD